MDESVLSKVSGPSSNLPELRRLIDHCKEDVVESDILILDGLVVMHIRGVDDATREEWREDYYAMFLGERGKLLEKGGRIAPRPVDNDK